MYFRDFDLVVRKTADIISMRWLAENSRPHPKALYVVNLAGDELCYLDEDSFNEVSQGPWSFIGAPVGTILLEDVSAEDGTSEVERSPVIAWAISSAGKPLPVTATGRYEFAFWHVLLPDGKVCGADGQTYPSELKYLSETGKS